jgi:hypothetical protein
VSKYIGLVVYIKKSGCLFVVKRKNIDLELSDMQCDYGKKTTSFAIGKSIFHVKKKTILLLPNQVFFLHQIVPVLQHRIVPIISEKV